MNSVRSRTGHRNLAGRDPLQPLRTTAPLKFLKRGSASHSGLRHLGMLKPEHVPLASAPDASSYLLFGRSHWPRDGKRTSRRIVAIIGAGAQKADWFIAISRRNGPARTAADTRSIDSHQGKVGTLTGPYLSPEPPTFFGSFEPPAGSF